MPVVVTILLVPVDVNANSWPLLTVVTTVVNSWSEVDTSAVVLTEAVVRGGGDDGAGLVAGAFDVAGSLLLDGCGWLLDEG